MASRARLKQLFEAAADLPRGDRADFLALGCGGDDALRSEIENLLAADDAADGFLESSPFGASISDDDGVRTRSFIGETIGEYQIEREIGVGGMGSVFLATRGLGDVRQRVAVKIVHQGAHSKEIIRRFLLERKILAGLEHASIARLIDVGETPDGLPFLVMEYVDGRPLDEYCATIRLSIDERLRIFQRVCSAVAYAHRRLIIHRDLKPSNILVTADGDVKLLDFGIAKLLDLDTDTPQSATLMNLLTPAYAAPEQIRGDAVTTATDVYGLGVILFELLAGVRPFTFGTSNYQEIVRVICDAEPPRPSEAVTLEHNPINANAPVSARKYLRGDLDNIVLKALRKDPERRYQAVEQFSDDIGRYLNGMPVSARADTFSYRAAKFFERNRVAVISFGLIMVALVGGIVGTTWQAVRAARQQQIAEQRFAQVREIANNVVFKYHDAIANLNGSTEVRQMLVADATSYLDQLSKDNWADEDLQFEAAAAYEKLADVQGKPFSANTGDTAGALVNYRKSIGLLETLQHSAVSANVARAENVLITACHSYSALSSRTGDLDEAVASQKKVLDLAQRHRDADPADLKKRLDLARSVLWLGDAYSENDRYAEGAEYYRRSLALAEEVYPTASGDKSATTLLAVAHDRIGRTFMLHAAMIVDDLGSPRSIADIYTESYEHLEKALVLFKQVADADPENQKYRRNYIDGQANLGTALRNIGEFDRSLAMLQNVADITTDDLRSDAGNRQLGSDVAGYRYQLALTLVAKHDSSHARSNFDTALAIMDKLIAADPANAEFRKTRNEIATGYRLTRTSSKKPAA